MKAARQFIFFGLVLLALLGAVLGGFFVIGPLVLGRPQPTAEPSASATEAAEVNATDVAAVTQPPEATRTPKPTLTRAPTRTPRPTRTPSPTPAPTLEATAEVTSLAMPSPVPPEPSPTAEATETANPSGAGGSTPAPSPNPAPPVPLAPAEIAVVPASLTVMEPAGSASFMVGLTREPAAPVILSFATSNAQCRASPEQIVLDRDTWQAGVAVTVTAVDDAIADGLQACEVRSAAAVSAAGDYNGKLAAPVMVTVVDDDDAGIVVAPTGLTLSEPNGSGTFSVNLSSQPLSPVTIALALSSAQCSVSPAAVVLDAGNWRTGVAVTVTALDDAVADGVQTCTVETGAANSGDPSYSGMPSDDVLVTVLDDDQAAIVVSPSSLAVSEPEGSATFAIALTSEPAAPVTVLVTPSSAQCSVSPAEAVLDAANWRAGVLVTVVAVDDAKADGVQTCLVETAGARSTSPEYDGLASDDVTVTVVDDDRAGILISPPSLTLNEPAGLATVTIALTSEPLSPVTVALAASSAECSVAPSQVILDGANWRAGAPVTVAAVDDAVADGVRTCAIVTAPAESPAPDYSGMPSPGVTVAVVDDDQAGVLVEPMALALSEPDGSATFRLGLTSQPTATVVVSITADAQTIVSPTQLSFAEADWLSQPAVTVSVADDRIAQGTRTAWVGLSVGSGDANYDGLALESVAVTLADDDVAGVVVTPTQILLVEGGSPASYQVELTSQPTAGVTITLAADASLVLTPTVLHFTEASWSVPQPVTVVAVDDGRAQSVRTATISHALRSADVAYAKLRVAEVKARVTGSTGAGSSRPGTLSQSRAPISRIELPKIQVNSGLVMTLLVFGLTGLAVAIEYLRTR